MGGGEEDQVVSVHDGADKGSGEVATNAEEAKFLEEAITIAVPKDGGQNCPLPRPVLQLKLP